MQRAVSTRHLRNAFYCQLLRARKKRSGLPFPRGLKRQTQRFTHREGTELLKQTITTMAVIAFSCSGLVQAQSQAMGHNVIGNPAQPDLRIKQVLFSPANDKLMKVHVVNLGNATSGLCILRLTVRKINGVAVGRVKEVKLLPLAARKDKWIVVDAKSILPNNISLESTVFKLNADATSIIAESDETNNELWHNL
jgi:CARDB